MTKDPITSNTVSRDARDFARNRKKSRSAMNSERASESNEFSEEAQKNSKKTNVDPKK